MSDINKALGDFSAIFDPEWYDKEQLDHNLKLLGIFILGYNSGSRVEVKEEVKKTTWGSPYQKDDE